MSSFSSESEGTMGINYIVPPNRYPNPEHKVQTGVSSGSIY